MPLSCRSTDPRQERLSSSSASSSSSSGLGSVGRRSSSASLSLSRTTNTFEDRRMLRRLAKRKSKQRHGTRTDSSIQERRESSLPVSFQWFQSHFAGRFGFFSELALFRHHHPNPPISSTTEKVLKRLIDVVGLARVATLRSIQECDFCSQHVTAPFCARSPAELHPAGTRQHGLAVSDKCLLQRALGTILPSPDRIRALFWTNSGTTLRLVNVIDERGNKMQMLPLYLSTLWKVLHTLELGSINQVMEIVMHSHGLYNPAQCALKAWPPEQRRRFEQLLMQQLDPARYQDRDEQDERHKFAQLHLVIFGADWADLAMQAIMVALNAETSSNMAMVRMMPQSWMQDVAEAIHVDYPQEQYLRADGQILTVERHPVTMQQQRRIQALDRHTATGSCPSQALDQRERELELERHDEMMAEDDLDDGSLDVPIQIADSMVTRQDLTPPPCDADVDRRRRLQEQHTTGPPQTRIRPRSRSEIENDDSPGDSVPGLEHRLDSGYYSSKRRRLLPSSSIPPQTPLFQDDQHTMRNIDQYDAETAQDHQTYDRLDFEPQQEPSQPKTAALDNFAIVNGASSAPLPVLVPVSGQAQDPAGNPRDQAIEVCDVSIDTNSEPRSMEICGHRASAVLQQQGHDLRQEQADHAQAAKPGSSAYQAIRLLMWDILSCLTLYCIFLCGVHSGQVRATKRWRQLADDYVR